MKRTLSILLAAALLSVGVSVAQNTPVCTLVGQSTAVSLPITPIFTPTLSRTYLITITLFPVSIVGQELDPSTAASANASALIFFTSNNIAQTTQVSGIPLNPASLMTKPASATINADAGSPVSISIMASTNILFTYRVCQQPGA
jgi:hypothetical protein